MHIECKFLHGATIMEGSVVTMYIVYEGSICMCVLIYYIVYNYKHACTKRTSRYFVHALSGLSVIENSAA